MHNPLDDRLILIDKEPGCTSFDLVRSVRRLGKLKRVGHCGSLDPGATGLLVLCTGAATRISSLFLDLEKEYVARIRFGIATDTYDAQGKVTETAEVGVLDPVQIKRTLQEFLGTIQQVPPMVSALKHKGKRLYQLARQGIEVEREARPVQVYEIEFLHLSENAVDIRVRCGRGCYIRSLAVDVGSRLGLPAHLEKLRRTSIGTFHVNRALTLEEFKEGATSETSNATSMPQGVYSVPEALQFFPGLRIRESYTAAVLNGAQPQIEFLEELPQTGGMHRLLSSDGKKLVALARVDGRKHFALLRLQRVFQEPLSWVECEAGAR